MKKKILAVLILLLSMTIFVACNGDTDRAPILEGVGNIEHQKNEPFDPMAGVSAIDKRDGDITDEIEVTGFAALDITKVGTYEITYKVTNSNGKTREVVRVVTIFEPKKPPVFTGVGNEVVAKGTTFDPKEGVGAKDKDKNDVEVVVVGEVNVNQVGKYELLYSATDAQNVTGYATRQVLVVEDVASEHLSLGLLHHELLKKGCRIGHELVEFVAHVVPLIVGIVKHIAALVFNATVLQTVLRVILRLLVVKIFIIFGIAVGFLLAVRPQSCVVLASGSARHLSQSLVLGGTLIFLFHTTYLLDVNAILHEFRNDLRLRGSGIVLLYDEFHNLVIGH